MQEYDIDLQDNAYNDDKKQSKTFGKLLNGLMTVIIVFLIIAIILLTTTITSIGVQGDSMMPNVLEGDRLVLLKWGYKLNYGDIVVFHREEDESAAVKRVIGKGGDVIAFDLKAYKWVRNGEYVDEEEYFGGEYNDIYINSMNGDLKKNGITVEEGHLFVLGDNRNIPGGYSKDSHMYGTLPQDTLMGKVIKIIRK